MGKSKKPIEIFVQMIYLMYFSQQNGINMDFKSQTPNSEFLTEDQEKLFGHSALWKSSRNMTRNAPPMCTNWSMITKRGKDSRILYLSDNQKTKKE